MATIIKLPVVFAVPALDIDKRLYAANGGVPHERGKVEHRIVYNLIAHMYVNGFRLHSVYDGEETESYAASLTQEQATKLAMENVFNLDEASVRFIATNATSNKEWRGVLIALGNGVDCIADWNFAKDDPDGFNAVMDAFDPHACA